MTAIEIIALVTLLVGTLTFSAISLLLDLSNDKNKLLPEWWRWTECLAYAILKNNRRDSSGPTAGSPDAGQQLLYGVATGSI